MYGLDIRIMAVPERADVVDEIQRQAGVREDRTFWDTEHLGPRENAKRAWLFPPSASHVMLLQDDIELCDGFVGICERMINAHPEAIISLFPARFTSQGSAKGYPQKGPYISVRRLSGCGLIMPASWIPDCLASWRDDVLGDDTQVEVWADKNDIPRLSTLPSTIQHRDMESAFDPTRRLGGTAYFLKNPDWVNWDSRYVTPESNVIRRV